MFDPQIGNTFSTPVSKMGTKRLNTTVSFDRQVKAKSDKAEPTSAMEAGRIASHSKFGGSWYSSLTDYSEWVNKRVCEMIQKSTDDIKQGNFASSQDTVYRLAKYKLCKELELFVGICPDSKEIRSGLNRALSAAVDEGDPGIVAYLIALGADPVCQTEGSCALNTAAAFVDGSPKRDKVLSIIEQSLKAMPLG